MSQYFEIHPENPQKRLIKQAVDIIQNGGLIVYPTDSSYALGCLIGDKNAMELWIQVRGDVGEVGCLASLAYCFHQSAVRFDWLQNFTRGIGQPVLASRFRFLVNQKIDML